MVAEEVSARGADGPGAPRTEMLKRLRSDSQRPLRAGPALTG